MFSGPGHIFEKENILLKHNNGPPEFDCHYFHGWGGRWDFTNLNKFGAVTYLNNL